MNGHPSDGSENVIDIFVLSKSDSEAPLTTEHLAQRGYRITLFPDSAHLIEALRSGKPNLLICDSVSLGEEAYRVCRQLKTDNNCWMIPVLILTGASSLTDLLYILDCNADNFIAHPAEPAYLHSLIEGMLTTPVERQTPDQIKTQFKIRHDDQEFVVTADRRRLLEFLLSSFEIAVNTAGELQEARSRIASLRETLKRAEESGQEQARIIEIINATVVQKDQELATLTSARRDLTTRIEELTREKEFLLEERDENRTRLDDAEARYRAAEQEQEELRQVHAAEMGEQKERIEYISEELATTSADLVAGKQALELVIGRLEAAEAEVRDIAPRNEQLARSLQALSLDYEQLKATHSAERNRAQSAEQELRAVIQVKTTSEQDLSRILDDLKNTARRQAEDLVAARDELGAGRERIASLESKLGVLAAEKEQMECGLKKEAGMLQHELEKIRENYTETAAALEKKKEQVYSLEKVLAELKTTLAHATGENRDLRAEMDMSRQTLEQERAERVHAENELRKAIDERDAKLADLQGAHDEARTDLSAHRDDLAAARAGLSRASEERAALEGRLNETETQVRTLREQLSTASKTQAESDKKVRSLADELDRLTAALEAERRQNRTSDEELKSRARVLEQHRRDLELAQNEQARLTAILDAERERTRISGEELRVRVLAADQIRRDLEMAREEQARLAAALTAEQEQNRARQDELQDRTRALEEVQKELELAREERVRLTTALSAERDERRVILERACATGETKDKRINDLAHELEAAVTRIHQLENEILAAARAREIAEGKVASLSAEIDEARTALADEWEDHMNAQELLESADNERKQMAASARTPGAPTPEVPGDRRVVVRTTPLPREPEPFRQENTMSNPPEDQGAPGAAGAASDSVRDDDPGRQPDDEMPTVTIICDTDPVVTLGMPYESEETLPAADDQIGIHGEPEEDPKEDETQDQNADPDGYDEYISEEQGEDSGYRDPAVPGISHAPRPAAALPPAGGLMFTRTQWLDLLKWSHHSGLLSQDQRLQIIRMGRLIQRGRRLTRKQEDQVREMITEVQSLGYRFT